MAELRLTFGDEFDASDECEAAMEAAETDDEGEITFRTSDVEGVGDDALGLTMDMHITTQGVTVSMQMYGVLWERDGVHATVAGYGGLDSSTMAGVPIDHAFVEDLARTSDQRLAGALPD